jgi:hypothetical protein
LRLSDGRIVDDRRQPDPVEPAELDW